MAKNTKASTVIVEEAEDVEIVEEEEATEVAAETEILGNRLEGGDVDTLEASVYDALFACAENYQPEGQKKFTSQGKREGVTDFLMRLLEHISSTPQEVFDALPETAQNWFQEAAEAFNGGQPIPSPEGFVPVSAGRAALTGEKPAKPAKAPRPPKQPVAPRARQHDTNSVGWIIREALVKDQSTTPEQLRQILKDRGHNEVKQTTISSYHADTSATLRVAMSLGLFTANPAKDPAA